MADPIETNSTPQEPTPTPAPAPTPEPTPTATPKIFSEDYVKALRNEAKSYRVAGKSYESALKKLFNLSDDEELGDIDKRITDFNARQQKAIDEANNKMNEWLINAELQKAIGEDYNEKLTRKLIDYSAIKVEDGKVTGIKEALEALAAEYPEILKQNAPQPAPGTGSSKIKNEDSDAAAFRKALGLEK